MKADWAAKSNEPRAAAEMYLSAGETMKVSSLTTPSHRFPHLIEQEQTKFDDLRRGLTKDFQRLAKFQRTLLKEPKKSPIF